MNPQLNSDSEPLDESMEAVNRKSTSDKLGDQYLSFDVGREQFAVNILSVQEIRGWKEPTILPNSPMYIKGVLNLRGTIVPVMDLRFRFGFEKASYLDTTVIIILKINENKRERLMGCIVDAVSDVFNLQESEINKIPEYKSTIEAKFILGAISIEERVITLLELDNLLSLEQIKHPYAGSALS
jgi:purine-binding chemotaxis protein CheW